MAKPGPRKALRKQARSDSTREQIVRAAIETLKREGFAGTSARAIAATGGFNQALVFYHFGTVNELLLAALDRTSEERMARYREVVEGAASLGELVDAALRIYREDLESGHIKVLAEVIAGSSSVPGLGEQIVARMEPWVRFTEDTFRRVLVSSPFEGLIPPEQLARATVALYLGLEIITHLDGDRTHATQLFETAGRLATLVAPIFKSVGLQERRDS
jgi:AcrR family transcriptional regulator